MFCEIAQKILKSPLRYPGGKGLFALYFSELIEQNELSGCRYFEPFAGGAGVGIGLLSLSKASELILNDADYHIYCFWDSVLKHNIQFIEAIQDVKLSIEEWQKQRIIYYDPRRYSVFEVGFSTFYLNRCNRSGILAGAGPIGGQGQMGKWKLDARFNKENLIIRIADIGLLAKRIVFHNMDAIEFLKTCLPRGRGREKVFVYADPPYVSAGNKLYLNFYCNNDHEKLSGYLLQQEKLKWVVTYDDASLIRELYSTCQMWLFHLGYSLQVKQKGKELLIAPKGIILPKKNKLFNARWDFERKIKEE
ncbi:MAG: DNA adenine methylase [Candidatus Omnitrophota bacterium]